MLLNLAHHLETALSQAAAGMTGKTFAVTALDSVADLPVLEEPIGYLVVSLPRSTARHSGSTQAEISGRRGPA